MYRFFESFGLVAGQPIPDELRPVFRYLEECRNRERRGMRPVEIKRLRKRFGFFLKMYVQYVSRSEKAVNVRSHSPYSRSCGDAGKSDSPIHPFIPSVVRGNSLLTPSGERNSVAHPTVEPSVLAPPDPPPKR